MDSNKTLLKTMKKETKNFVDFYRQLPHKMNPKKNQWTKLVETVVPSVKRMGLNQHLPDNKAIALILTGFLMVSFVGASSVGTEFENSMYWLQKPAWTDLPSYAEDTSIQYSATDLIQERVTREVCTDYNYTSMECLKLENKTMPGSNAPVLSVKSGNWSYLGNGNVRTNISIGLNELSTQTLKESTFLMNEQEYIKWFNQRYYYDGGNITSPDVDELQAGLKSMSVYGGKTNLRASRINSLEITSLSPFRASADVTMVLRFDDFRTGSFVLSDLYRVEVDSGLEN